MSFDFFKKASFRYATAGFSAAVVGGLLYYVGVPVAREFNDSFAMKEFRQYGVLGTYRHHFFSCFERFHDLANLENENESLKSQLALLEKRATLENSEKAEQELAAMNSILEKKVKLQAGSEDAHLPQSILYQVPPHLTPAQLYTLALAYFRKQEFEKTVTLLNALFELPADPRYQTAENFLLSGISWYNLKNYELARKNVDASVGHSSVKEDVHRQAMLWAAIVEKAEGKNQLAQARLLRFIGDYPHTAEARWVNGGRAPAKVNDTQDTSSASTKKDQEEGAHESQ